MPSIVLATWNRDKQIWMAAGLRQTGLPIVPIRKGEIPEADETEETCEDNAMLKAAAVRQAWEAKPDADSGMNNAPDNTGTSWRSAIVVAEDSGLFIHGLAGFPGVRTARFAAGSDDTRSEILLKRMQLLQGRERQACFVSAVAVNWPDGQTHVYRGELHGEITFAPEGTFSGGYDRIFRLPGGQTLASLPPDEWQSRDHRRQALNAAAAGIRSRLQDGSRHL